MGELDINQVDFDRLDEDEDFQRQNKIDLFLEKSRRKARRIADEEEAAALAEPRVRRTAAEQAELPKITTIIDEVLPGAAPALLTGPQEAGKSLLARDWCLHVASGVDWLGRRVHERRTVLYIMDEGAHDFAERWMPMTLWESAKHDIQVLDVPVNLLSQRDVDDLFKEYADVRPGLVVFDTIYGMGTIDDNTSKDSGPVIDAMKRISRTWNCCTLGIGHTGHNREKRMRGSSMWSQRTDVSWHMDDGELTCERSKIGNKARLGWSYQIEYPRLRFLDFGEVLSREEERETAVKNDIKLYPHDSARNRAKRLCKKLGLGDTSTRTLISRVTKDMEQEADGN